MENNQNNQKNDQPSTQPVIVENKEAAKPGNTAPAKPADAKTGTA